MENPYKDSDATEAREEIPMEGVDTAHKAHQAACDLCQEREV